MAKKLSGEPGAGNRPAGFVVAGHGNLGLTWAPCLDPTFLPVTQGAKLVGFRRLAPPPPNPTSRECQRGPIFRAHLHPPKRCKMVMTNNDLYIGCKLKPIGRYHQRQNEAAGRTETGLQEPPVREIMRNRRKVRFPLSGRERKPQGLCEGRYKGDTHTTERRR